MIEKLPIQKDAELLHDSPELEKELDTLHNRLKVEIELIQRNNPMLGEGRVAKVFDLSTAFHDTTLCVKLYRPDISQLNTYTRQSIQPLNPEEEFDLQNELFQADLRVPQPILFDHINQQPFIVMEKIPGYTLAEIHERGGFIVQPPWHELERMAALLNNTLHVVHRDLHLGNIMLKTKQSIMEARENLEGDLYFIDFGTAKRTFGQPTDEDYSLTIGNDVIKYQIDRSSINALQPSRPGIQGSSLFLR